jgi:Rrf2 family protein
VGIAVNISAKVEYACVAVLELALRWDREEPVRVRDIAEHNGIPSRFLVQILLQLKGAGLVQSTRGATGGYLLARPPKKISLGEVMGVIEGRPAQLHSNLARETTASRVLLGVWNDVSTRENKQLCSISFQDLIERVSAVHEEMYYI